MDLRSKHYCIIDNDSSGETTDQRYGAVPGHLRDLFFEFLAKKELNKSASVVKTMKPSRMPMAWRDPGENQDNGVFAMRHMETYIGQKIRMCECGLKRMRPDIVLGFSKEYLHDITTSGMNSLVVENIKTARAFEVHMEIVSTSLPTSAGKGQAS